MELKRRIQIMESSAEESLVNLRTQYENQIENIRKLRQLYEERAEATTRGIQKEIEKEKAKNVLLELKVEEYAKGILINQDLNGKINDLEKQLAERETEVNALKEERASLAAACSNVTSQLSLINNLFSNMLTGDMNFDLFTQLLQDNHNLITDLIANGDINDTAALLVNIAEKAYTKDDSPKDSSQALSAKEEIASNLPKVWRVLIELLNSHENSCHIVPGTSEDCYKNVQTPNGSRTVISVSQTFLRLKDLILEKNSLVKEVTRLKTLNGHLENRLDLQEKRLSVVTSELRKTWGIVSKLKVQHRQLHTHEKVLRYELQHKRHMLTDLKQELEYCKETWDKVREKNIQTEHDWELLRKEFALRKSRDVSNSAESGYEDDENSQSPDLSSSDLEYDLSPSSDDPKSSELDGELEDAASDATVIELIDLLEFDGEDSVGDEQIKTDNTSTSEVLPQPAIDDKISNDSMDSKSDAANSSDAERTSRTSEEILNARAARLRRLEQQCRSLLNQMALTSLRSDTLSTRLEELHEQYGSEERRSQSSQNVDEKEVEESENPSEETDDERKNRVQKMEETCMQILDNVTVDSPEVKLENVYDFAGRGEERGTVDMSDAGNETEFKDGTSEPNGEGESSHD